MWRQAPGPSSADCSDGSGRAVSGRLIHLSVSDDGNRSNRRPPSSNILTELHPGGLGSGVQIPRSDHRFKHLHCSPLSMFCKNAPCSFCPHSRLCLVLGSLPICGWQPRPVFPCSPSPVRLANRRRPAERRRQSPDSKATKGRRGNTGRIGATFGQIRAKVS